MTGARDVLHATDDAAAEPSGQLSLPFLGNASVLRARAPWGGANVHPLAVAAVNAQNLNWLVACRPEPVRHARIELRDLARAHRDVVLAEDQPHLAREDVQPLVAFVGAELALSLRRDDDLPDREPGRLLRERKDQTAVAGARLETNARVSYLRRADQFVERHLVRVGERQEQFEARLPLAALQPGERALRDARFRGKRGQGDAAAAAQPLQARANLGENIRDPRRVLHGLTLLDCSQKQQRKWRRSPRRGTLQAMDKAIYDVVIVGGGAAGLSAALVLGRARRHVAVIDAGTPRNAPAEHTHGFLSRDGMPPSDLLQLGREEATGYGVEFISDRVVSIEPGFSVALASGETLAARRLLIATGATDELPAISGLAERWGRDFLHCPYCHGWEVRDQPLGVLGTGLGSVEHAQLIREWSDDLVFFAHTYNLTETEREQLEARGIRVVDGEVRQVVVEDDRLRGVVLGDGRTVGRAALFVRPHMRPRATGFVERLGCEVDDQGFVRVDGTGGTNVAGVWAAGNVANPRAQVITAAGEGSAAAIAINADLVQEDVQRSSRGASDQHSMRPKETDGR
jgi:thioredoxin reductase